MPGPGNELQLIYLQDLLPGLPLHVFEQQSLSLEQEAPAGRRSH